MTAHATIRQGRIGLALILPLAMLTALDAMAIDMYLPGMPAIAAAFGVEPGQVQQTLAVFLIGLALGQGIYGPLLDRFGRRLPLLIGIAIFIAGSVMGALAPDLHWLLAARFVQALGAAAGLVTPRAIVTDLCDLTASARAFSLLMQVMMVAPIVAPIVGGHLLGLGDWRSIFWALAGCGVVALAWTFAVVPDSLAAERRVPLALRAVGRAYLAQLGNTVFTAYALAGGMALASLFVYISGSAFVFTAGFGLDPTGFSHIFAANSVALVIGGALADQLLKRGVAARRILLAGLVAHAGVALCLFATTLVAGLNLRVYMLLLALAIGALGLVFGNLTALAMAAARGQAGVASALLGMLQYLVSALVGYLASLFAQGAAMLPLALGLCGGAAILATLVGRRVERRAARPAPQAAR